MKQWLAWTGLWLAFLGIWKWAETKGPSAPWLEDPAHEEHQVEVATSSKADADSGVAMVDFPRPNIPHRPNSTLPDSLQIPEAWRFEHEDDAAVALEAFFLALELAHDQRVDVFHWGDSQIEGDRISSDLRMIWQSEWGGQGPGWIMPNSPTASAALRTRHDQSWLRTTGFGRNRMADARRLPFFALNTWVGDSPWVHSPKTKAQAPNSGWTQTTIWALDTSRWIRSTATPEESDVAAIHRLNFATKWMHAPVIGKTTIHGFQGAIHGIELSSPTGVYVHNLAMRGGFGVLFDNTPAEDWQWLRSEQRPALVLLQFGGNAAPGLTSSKQLDKYSAEIGKNIRHVQAQWPDVPIVFVGPSDMGEHPKTYPLLGALVDSLRAESMRTGALFWDLRKAMGGAGSMPSWVEQRLAAKDHVHFSPSGAHEIGRRLAEAFSYEHNRWKLLNHQDNPPLP